MNLLFSTTAAAVQSEIDAKFPTYGTQAAIKQLLFSRLRDAGRLPVRFLQDTISGSDYEYLVDVPSASSPGEVSGEVTPFTVSAG
jgi:hypothetical protein